MVNGYQPQTLAEALELRATKNVIPYAGGTDLMIEAPADANYLFLGKLQELKGVTECDDCIRIGAATTFSEIMESKVAPEFLKAAVAQIAAPAIRNLGTVGGNICNGSAKGDSALIFFAANAKLRLCSSNGERVLPIEDFYLGKKKTDLRQDELLTEIFFAKDGLDDYYYQKVGARKALAISRVAFAGLLQMKEGRITLCSTAFGAVSDVVIKRKEIDSMLLGKTTEEAKQIKAAYLAAYDQAIVPVRGRISAEYRKTVCMNLLDDFLNDKGI